MIILVCSLDNMCKPSFVINPWRACAGGLRYLVCVCVCVSVCPAPRVLPLRVTERPTEGTYGFGAILNVACSLKMLCSKVMA